MLIGTVSIIAIFPYRHRFFIIFDFPLSVTFIDYLYYGTKGYVFYRNRLLIKAIFLRFVGIGYRLK